MRLALTFPFPSIRLLGFCLLAATACRRHDGQNPNDPGSGTGQVHGRLAAATGQPASLGLRGLFADVPGLWSGVGRSEQAMSLDDVTVDLLSQGMANNNGGNNNGGNNNGGSPDSWAVFATATPDASGAFVFDSLPEDNYTLKVNQPEFASVAYRVDSTDFHLGQGQTVSLVLPLITSLEHGLNDPLYVPMPGGTFLPATALDHATGEVAITTTLGVAIVNPDHGTMDLVMSRNLFTGMAALALAPNSNVLWVLYGDHLVRIDRSLFTDPAESEIVDFDDLATRQAIGDKIRFRMLPPPVNFGMGYDPNSGYFMGGRYFSPDEKILYASTQNAGTMVIDLEAMEIVRVIMGRVIGYNPVSNHLFFGNGDSSGTGSTEVLVVDASTRLEVNVVELDNVRGVAPVPESSDTVLVGSQLSTSDAQIPFVKVVDGTGTVIVDERAKDYLGIDDDPPAGAPSFDLTGQYFMIGSTAFRVLEGGGFEPVPTGIPPGQFFGQQVSMSNNLRAVDPANLYEIWYGSWGDSDSVALISLDQTNVPVAVRPGVSVRDVLLDQTHGRAIFWDTHKLVFVHYADPTAASHAEVIDLSAMITPFVQGGAICSSSTPCSGTDVCAGATDTSFSGRCMKNPRLPYLPFCGGFGNASCDDGFTCSKLNPTNPNSVGICTGQASRDYAAHGPACGGGLSCPAGMLCGTGSHCEPKPCVRDADCATWPGEICGAVELVGRVCVTPGTYADGAYCSSSDQCQHGACVAVRGAADMLQGSTDLRYGPVGIRVCGAACYQNADCAGDAPCIYKSFNYNNYTPTSVSSQTVWMTHLIDVTPFCASTNLEQIGSCTDQCEASELCVLQNPTPYCSRGYSATLVNPSGMMTADMCMAPTELTNQMSGPTSCLYSCRRSGDCPFTTDCANGHCSIGDSQCDFTCATNESCAWFGWNNQPGICLAVDGCRSDADCGGTTGSCVGAGLCLGALRCSNNAGCVGGEECVALGPYDQNDQRFCLPARCGCTGAHASEMLCRAQDDLCFIPETCTDIPCDGTVVALCDQAQPSPSPSDCQCPACWWNGPQCTGMPASLCPADFACRFPGVNEGQAPAHTGRQCVCNSASCQTP